MLYSKSLDSTETIKFWLRTSSRPDAHVRAIASKPGSFHIFIAAVAEASRAHVSKTTILLSKTNTVSRHTPITQRMNEWLTHKQEHVTQSGRITGLIYVSFVTFFRYSDSPDNRYFTARMDIDIMRYRYCYRYLNAISILMRYEYRTMMRYFNIAVKKVREW